MSDDIRDDLAYVKALAEEGRDTPLVNGIFFVIWGGLITIAALVFYAHTAGVINLGPYAGIAPWVAAFIIGWVLSFAVGRRTAHKPGASTLGNKTAMAVWFACGIFISGFWITLLFVHDDFQHVGVPAYFLFNMMFPIAFGLYGVAFYATATAGRVGWLKWFAAIAWLCAILSLFFFNSPIQILIGAAGSLLAGFLPGVILMRREPSDIV